MSSDISKTNTVLTYQDVSKGYENSINKMSLELGEEVRKYVESELELLSNVSCRSESTELVPLNAEGKTANSITYTPKNNRKHLTIDMVRRIELDDCADRAIQRNEHRRHHGYIQNCLNDHRYRYDREPIIPLEQKFFHKDTMPWLPRSLEEIVVVIASTTGLQYQGIVMAVLASLLIAVQGRVWLRINPEWREIAVIMLLQSAASGSRKTYLVSLLRQAFDDYVSRKSLIYMQTHSKNKLSRKITSQIANGLIKEAIRRKIQESIDNELSDLLHIKDFIDECVENEAKILSFAPHELSPCTLLSSKCSRAGALKLLLKNGGCLGCITDEADMLTSLLLNPTKGEPSLILHGHTGQCISETNGHGDIYIPQIAIPMINIVQGSEMSKLYTNHRQIEQGLVHRLVPHIYGKPHKSSQVEAEAFEVYNQKIQKLLNMFYTQDCFAPKYEVQISKEGVNSIEYFRDEINNYITPYIPISAKPYCEKACGLVARLAFAIHAWNAPNPLEGEITTEEVEQSCCIVRETFPHARFAYAQDGLSAQQDAIRIVSSFLRINPEEDRYIISKGFDSRRIRQRTRLTPERIDNALRFLERHNAISVYDDSSPNIKIHLHRDFFSFFSQQNYNS